jgi:hypothetical protein
VNQLFVNFAPSANHAYTMKNHFLIFIAAWMAVQTPLLAQDRKDKTPVTFEELYDEPYSVNKLFVGFQPMYGELLVANVNAGFGVEASYYLKDKLDFRAHFRKTYSRKFFDFARDQALSNSDVDNVPGVYNYFEVGATYHVKDFEMSSKTKMFLYKNSYKGNRWAARVPLFADVPCKVRKIYGVRVGGIMWDTSTDINRALDKQGMTLEDLGLPSQEFDPNGEPENVDVFTNMASTTFYLGGSAAWIKNVAVSFDKFEEGIDDLMFTVFLDIMYSPVLTLDDIVYTAKDTSGEPDLTTTSTYSISPLKTQPLGMRVGIDGKFNRTLSWSYGGEVGFRPGIEGRTFYALFKISFPVYSTNLDYKVESFGK